MHPLGCTGKADRRAYGQLHGCVGHGRTAGGHVDIARALVLVFASVFASLVHAGACEDLAATCSAWTTSMQTGYTNCVAQNPSNPNVCGAGPPTACTMQSRTQSGVYEQRAHYVWVPALSTGQPAQIEDTAWLSCGGGECAYPFVMQGGSCVCPTPLIEREGQCVENCAPKMGQLATGSNCTAPGACGYSYKASDVNGGMTVRAYGRYCAGNCVVKGNIEWCGQLASTSLLGSDRGWCGTQGSFYTGDYCNQQANTEVTYDQSSSTTSTATAVPAPSKVPKGKCPGEVNGVPVLVDCGVTVENKVVTSTSTVTSTDAGGSVTTSTTTTTKTSVVTCTDGHCTVSTNVTVSTGNGSGTSTVSSGSTTTATPGEACTENPDSAACKSSSFGGSCETGFQCDGDASTCAIAEAVNKSYCDQHSTVADEQVAAMRTGSWAGELSTTAKSLGDFDQSNPFGSACPGDQSFTAVGVTFVVPLASACSSLQMMGNLLVAFTLLGATIFVLRGLGST